jgi:hypothetical protein
VITLYLFSNYSWLIAQCTVCIILLSADAHSTDTGLKHSSSQIHFSTTQWIMQFCSYSLPCLLSTLAICYMQLTDSLWYDCPYPAEGWSCMPLLCFLNIWLWPSHSSVSAWHSVFSLKALAYCQPWHKGFADHHTTRHCCPLLTIISCVLYQRTTADYIVQVTINISRFTLRKFCI